MGFTAIDFLLKPDSAPVLILQLWIPLNRIGQFTIDFRGHLLKAFCNRNRLAGYTGIVILNDTINGYRTDKSAILTTDAKLFDRPAKIFMSAVLAGKIDRFQKR